MSDFFDTFENTEDNTQGSVSGRLYGAYRDGELNDGTLTFIAREEMRLPSANDMTALKTVNHIKKMKGFNEVFKADDPEDAEPKMELTENNVTFTPYATEEEKQAQLEKNEKGKTVLLGVSEKIVEALNEVIEEAEEQKPKEGDDRVREYKNTAVYPKIRFSKANTGSSILSKILFFVGASIATGIFFGVKTNSMYVATKQISPFGWIMKENLKTTMTPFNSTAFFQGFMWGFGILAVIGIFIWLDSDEKKNSRVGHEHGKARLGTKSDFKSFKTRFME